MAFDPKNFQAPNENFNSTLEEAQTLLSFAMSRGIVNPRLYAQGTDPSEIVGGWKFFPLSKSQNNDDVPYGLASQSLQELAEPLALTDVAKDVPMYFHLRADNFPDFYCVGLMLQMMRWGFPFSSIFK